MQPEAAQPESRSADRRPPDPILSGDLAARADRTIGAILRTLVAILPLLLVATWLTSTLRETIALALLTLAVAALFLIHRSGRLLATIHTLVALLVAYGVVSVATFGSIRSVGTLSFVGAIIVGGIFLSRAALITVVAVSALALGALTWAETSGWLYRPDFSVGFAQWITHATVIGAIAVNIFFARNLVVNALLHARGSEERLAKLFRSNPTVLLTTDFASGRILEVNESFCRIFGISREDSIGATTVELGLWNDLADRASFLARARAEGRVENVPATLRRRNGETFEALMSGEVLAVGDGLQLLTTASDISELVRTREALRVSEERFASIFRHNPAALLRTTLEEARILDMNESYERLFALDRGSAVGATTTSLDLWKNPADRVRFYERIRDGGRVENMPASFRRRDGGTFEALISGEVVQHDNERQLLSTITDISELVRAREALRATEERLARIFRSSPAAIIVTNFETRELVSANAAAERMFRMSLAEASGQSVGNRFYAEPERANAQRERIAREGRVNGVPFELLRADGERFQGRVSQELMEEAGVRYVITVVEDVSAETAARDALRASEQRFASAFRFSPIGMTITRIADGTILEVNDADQYTLGYSRDEVIGMKSTETGAWLSTTDRERFVARLRAEGSVSGYETRMRTKSGEQVDCMLWAAQMDLNGESCVLAATMNITDRKREEALILEIARGVSGETGTPFFRSLVEHLGRALQADIAIVGEIVDGSRVRTLAMLRNGAIAPDIEYALEGTPCETLSGQPVLTHYADRVSELFPRDLALAREGMRGYIGISLRDPQGSTIGVLNIVCRSPIPHSERTEALFRIFAARAQAELLRMRSDRQILALNESLESRVAERTAQLEAANRELEAFSYSVSHDLRAPLRSIDGFVRVLSGEHGTQDPAARARAQERVVSAVRRMNALIDDLLGLAQVSRQEIFAESVELSALALEVAGELLERDPGRRVEFSAAPDAVARGDRALLRIVLENLVGNAWKFTGRRADARIEFGTAALPGGETAYFVRDNGAGFDPEYADRLFAPFQRLHTDREFEGTGIGLATVQRIIARHGGRVWAKGVPEQGATFYFTCGAE